jgi:hypothetical protein
MLLIKKFEWHAACPFTVARKRLLAFISPASGGVGENDDENR